MQIVSWTNSWSMNKTTRVSNDTKKDSRVLIKAFFTSIQEITVIVGYSPPIWRTSTLIIISIEKEKN